MNDIFERWRGHYSGAGLDADSITQDGIVDLDQFNAASSRILFVMKESNDFGKGDLRDLVKSSYGTQTWLNLGRWTYGILNGFPDLGFLSRKQVLEWNRKAAFINLKKYTGGASTNWAEMNAFAFFDRELLREQITSIKPDIIVACGTFEILMWLLELDISLNCKSSPREGMSHRLDCRVIAHRHPSRAHPLNSYKELRQRLMSQ